MVATFTARFNDSVTVTSRYISYRTRVIDGSVIYEFRVKGRKVCINSYKQNGQFPTMCIHMATHDDAMKLYNSMMAHWYPDGEDEAEEGEAELDDEEGEGEADQAELDDEDDEEGEADQAELDHEDEAELEEEDDDEDMPPLIPVQTPLYHYWYKTMTF